MTARKSLYFVLPLIALVLLACRVGPVRIDTTRVNGSGTLKTEERQVTNVERVALEDQGELEIIQGSSESLTIEADDNILPYITTEMRGRELVIGIKEGIRVEPSTPIRFTLSIKDLSRVSVSGSGDITAAKLESSDFEVSISGSGNVRMDNIQAENLQVRISGSGNFDLGGEVQTQEVSISGSGNYKAGSLASRRTDITITGSGNVTVWTTEELKIRVSGFGNVSYYGAPSVSQTITGGGEIRSLGEP